MDAFFFVLKAALLLPTLLALYGAYLLVSLSVSVLTYCRVNNRYDSNGSRVQDDPCELNADVSACCLGVLVAVRPTNTAM